MKKVYQKKYSIKTAKLIAISNSKTYTDHLRLEGDIYITKEKQWFIYGNKGTPIKFGEICTENNLDEKKIFITLSPDEARDFLLAHGFYNKAKDYFSINF